MRIPMLHTPSATGPVSSLIGESAIAQTVMHTNEAPSIYHMQTSKAVNRERNTHPHLSPVNEGNSQSALTESTKHRWPRLYISI